MSSRDASRSDLVWYWRREQLRRKMRNRSGDFLPCVGDTHSHGRDTHGWTTNVKQAAKPTLVVHTVINVFIIFTPFSES